MVQRIYALLTEHPAGMTVDDLHAELRDGWLDTDAYRAYEQYRKQKVYSQKRSDYRPTSEYGSDEFKRRAQRWWIRGRLGSMQGAKTAIRAEGRWYATNKVPRGWVPCVVRGGHLVPLNVQAKRAHDHADTRQHVRREELKARILDDLKTVRSPHVRETLNLLYNYLCGRPL
jgi:hypothetical protein